jgi:hypothetical protein
MISPFVTWQLTQVVLSGCAWYMGDTWEYMVGTQPMVRWQASQDRAVTKCADDLPVADIALWQVWHWPGKTPW